MFSIIRVLRTSYTFDQSEMILKKKITKAREHLIALNKSMMIL
jgi:hypothetical protein